jgi:hypothetical protein
MSIFGETPPVSIVGFILTILFFIIHLIGFASPVWNITKLLREKTEMGQKPKTYVFLVWTARSGSNNSKQNIKQ